MNVYDAAQQRLRYVFENFDNIVISFSGGKDSGVMLNLVLDYMKSNKINKTVLLYHFDYEAQYQMTTDYVDEVFKNTEGVLEPWRVCVPSKVTTCTSMSSTFWRPWELSKKDIWVRDLPAVSKTVECFPFFSPKKWDYDFNVDFAKYIHGLKKANKTVFLIGNRTQESQDRWRSIHSERNRKYEGKKWVNVQEEGIYKAYPIYDWKTDDVWIANNRFSWTYNKLYDLFFQAGLSIDKMRVASPFLSEGLGTLQLYKTIEPHTWSKLVSRVNGVSFAGIYGGTTAMGWKSITKPENHTWESYMHFLLKTLPKETRDVYIDKLTTSIKFWKERGGSLSNETIKDLKNAGVKFNVKSKSSYNTSKLPVTMEYQDDVSIKDFSLIPSFKRMCICIMKNDHLCKYMGFSQTKNEIIKRNNVIKKYKQIL